MFPRRYTAGNFYAFRSVRICCGTGGCGGKTGVAEIKKTDIINMSGFYNYEKEF